MFVAVKLQYIKSYISFVTLYYVQVVFMRGHYNYIGNLLTMHTYNELRSYLPGDGHTFRVHKDDNELGKY